MAQESTAPPGPSSEDIARFRRGMFAVLQPMLSRFPAVDLLVLLALPAIKQSELTRRVGMSSGTIVAALHRLIACGYVRSTPHHTGIGGTANQYAITPAGEALFIPAASPRKTANSAPRTD